MTRAPSFSFADARAQAGARSPLPWDAVMVDLDGTMVDTLGDFEFALNAMLDDLTLPHVSRATIETLVGKGSEHLIRSVLQQAAPGRATDSLYLLAWERYQAHYLRINGDFSDVFPGVIEGLSRLRAAGLKLACLTNKPTSFARSLIDAKGLGDFFSLVFGGDAFERKKPDPLPLQRTCEALGTWPSRTLMVGDSANDAVAARAAGCPVVLVTYGYNHGRPVQEVDADAYLDSLADLKIA